MRIGIRGDCEVSLSDLFSDAHPRDAALCPDCRRGEVVRRETYWDWWLERFSAAECAAMARAI